MTVKRIEISLLEIVIRALTSYGTSDGNGIMPNVAHEDNPCSRRLRPSLRPLSEGTVEVSRRAGKGTC